MNAQSIQEKIRKLLNMSVERGCTEDEAETAMRMAAGLAVRAGIDLDSLRDPSDPRPKIARKYAAQKMRVHESFIAHAAAVLYGVECMAPNHGKNGFWFTGREENIELAEHTILWLTRQIDILYRAALEKGLSKRERAEFRASFKDACAQRVSERASRLVWQMHEDEQTAQETTGHNALVVRSHFTQLRDEIRDYRRKQWEMSDETREAIRKMREADERWRRENPERAAQMDRETEQRRKRAERNARRRKGTIRTRQPKFGSGTFVGREAGERVQLRKEVER